MTYYLHANSTASVRPIATMTQYHNTDGTGAQTTSYSDSWSGSTLGLQSAAVTLPLISTGQNGSNSADNTTTTFFDTFGRPAWTQDADGYLSYTLYDDISGGILRTISDVNTSLGSTTGKYANLPSGWASPGSTGLHLRTEYSTDALGRMTMMTDPNSSTTYVVYNDSNHEVRTYPGWTGTATTGPEQVSRQDWGQKYADSMTLSGTISSTYISGGVPLGTEPLTGLTLQTLNRSRVNNAGQTIQSDAYFNFSSTTYSTSSSFGTLGTNFYRTSFDYDKRGRLSKTVSPTGTITRNEFDGLERLVSTFVGTNDTPSFGYWSLLNTAGTNMTEVASNVYDNGGVGDGNLTQSTQYPGDAAARVTQYFPDWRDRTVVRRSGVLSAASGTPTVSLSASSYETTESFDTTVQNRLIIPVTVSAPADHPITVTAARAMDGSASSSDVDFNSDTSIVIPAGQVIGYFNVGINNDSNSESRRDV